MATKSKVDDIDICEADLREGINCVRSYLDLQDVNFPPQVDVKKIKAVYAECDTLQILIAGKTGTGKSTLVNGLIGKRVAKEGVGVSTSGITTKLKAYDRQIGEVKVTVFDSPGLQDGTENEESYLKEMKEKCCDVDLVIFAIRMTDNKFVRKNPDAIAMAKITETFGANIWKKALVILTCADTVEAINVEMRSMDLNKKKKFFKKLIEDFKAAIHNTLMEDVNVPRKIAKRVKVVPTGHYSIKELVDGSLWFSNFWWESFTTIESAEGRAAMLKLNAPRLSARSKVMETDFLKQLEDQPIIMPSKEDVADYALVLGSIGISAIIGGGIGAIGF